MKKILFYMLLMITLVGVISCEKGEVVSNYTPFTNLIIENYENGYKIEIDGHKYASRSVKVPVAEGENAFKLYNSNDEIQFEGSFKLKPEKDTLLLFKIDEDIPATLMRKEALEEPSEEGKFKMKVANANKELSQLTGGKPFHLVFYQLMERSVRPQNRKAVYHEQGDTVRYITSTLPDQYQALDITDNKESVFGFEGRAQVLNEDESPLLIDGHPVYLSYLRLDMDVIGNPFNVVILVINNEASLGAEPYSFYPNIPPYWNYDYIFNTVYRK